MAKIASFFARPDPRGAREKYPKRRVVEACLYRLREGCRWRALPHDFPPCDTVFDQLAALAGTRRLARGGGRAGQCRLLSKEYEKTVASAEAWLWCAMMRLLTASMQIDFSVPLTLNSRILFGDVDTTEQYQIQAYSLVDGSYVPLSLGGWTHNAFSGQSGITPDATWAIWNSANGTLTAPGGNPQMNSPLDVLTPNQSVDRLVISKLSGTGGGWSFDVVNGVPEPSSTGAVAAGALGLWWMLRQRRNARASRS